MEDQASLTSMVESPAIPESPAPTATPLPTDTPEPAPTAAPPSSTAETAPPTALPTKIPRQPRRNLPAVAKIMVDANGKYCIPDRGDGCPWFEHHRETIAPADPKGDAYTEVISTTRCDADCS